MRPTLLPTLTIFLSFLLCTGCNGTNGGNGAAVERESAAKDVADSWLAAWRAGNFEKMWSVMDPELRRHIEQEGARDRFKGAFAARKLVEYKYTATETDPDDPRKFYIGYCITVEASDISETVDDGVVVVERDGAFYVSKFGRGE